MACSTGMDYLRKQKGRRKLLDVVPVDVDGAFEAAAQLVETGSAIVDVEDANDGALL